MCIPLTLTDIAASGLVAPMVGHVGDGSFHVSPLIDMENKAEIDAADASRLPSRHCHERHLREYMEEEHGTIALDLMRRIKASFDPQNLFNPGNLFAV